MKKLKDYADTFINASMFGAGIAIGMVIVAAIAKIL